MSKIDPEGNKKLVKARQERRVSRYLSEAIRKAAEALAMRPFHTHAQIEKAATRAREILVMALGRFEGETDHDAPKPPKDPNERKPCWQCGSRKDCDCGPEELGNLLRL